MNDNKGSATGIVVAVIFCIIMFASCGQSSKPSYTGTTARERYDSKYGAGSYDPTGSFCRIWRSNGIE